MPKAANGSLAATGVSEVLPATGDSPGGFSYRLSFTRSTGTLEYDIGRTHQGKPTFALLGTWTGTVVVERASGRGGANLDWNAMPGESYTANDVRVLE